MATVIMTNTRLVVLSFQNGAQSGTVHLFAKTGGGTDVSESVARLLARAVQAETGWTLVSAKVLEDAQTDLTGI